MMISSVSPSSPLLVYSLPNKCVRTEESAFNDRLFWSQLSNKVIRQCHDATGVLHLVGFSPQSLTIHTATAFSSIYHPKKKKNGEAATCWLNDGVLERKTKQRQLSYLLLSSAQKNVFISLSLYTTLFFFTSFHQSLLGSPLSLYILDLKSERH